MEINAQYPEDVEDHERDLPYFASVKQMNASNRNYQGQDWASLRSYSCWYPCSSQKLDISTYQLLMNTS